MKVTWIQMWVLPSFSATYWIIYYTQKLRNLSLTTWKAFLHILPHGGNNKHIFVLKLCSITTNISFLCKLWSSLLTIDIISSTERFVHCDYVPITLLWNTLTGTLWYHPPQRNGSPVRLTRHHVTLRLFFNKVTS